jgi:PHD/YefM family antitoxin component YafN of YafNO toxin-antitoxin module
MAPQFLTDIKGKKTGVFLSIKDYRKLMEELEELEDIKAYDKAKKRNEKTIPLRDAIKLRKKENLSHA